MKVELGLQKRKYIESERVTKLSRRTTHEINYQGKKHRCIWCGAFEEKKMRGNNPLR